MSPAFEELRTRSTPDSGPVEVIDLKKCRPVTIFDIGMNTVKHGTSVVFVREDGSIVPATISAIRSGRGAPVGITVTIVGAASEKCIIPRDTDDGSPRGGKTQLYLKK